MLKALITLVLVTVTTSVYGGEAEAAPTERAEDVNKILSLLDSYAQAFTEADADLAQSLVWLEDERFTEIEDMIPYPFGRDTYLGIMGWIRENAEPGKQEMRFVEPQIFFLAEDVAYLVTVQEIESGEGRSQSRVTLILIKKDEDWKMIHGHFSGIPKEE